MKILVTGTPRSGTTAYCDTLVQTNVVKQNFNECFNIEDLLIPRDKNTNKILLDGCSEQFLKSLDNFDWDTAWQLRPHHDPNNVYYQDYDENMQIYNKDGLPYKLEELKAQHNIRYDRLKKIDSWCIKIFRHHGVSNKMLEDIINNVNRIDIIFRKDRVQQAISLMIAYKTLNFHNVDYTNEDENFFDYGIFEMYISKTIREEKYLKDLYLLGNNILYYEDLDLTSSTVKKNKYSIVYDLDRCKEIAKKYD